MVTGCVFVLIDRGRSVAGKSGFFSALRKCSAKLMNVFFLGSFVIKELYVKLILNKLAIPLIILVVIAVYVRIPVRDGVTETDAALKSFYSGVESSENQPEFAKEYLSGLEGQLSAEKDKLRQYTDEGNPYLAQNASDNIDLLNEMISSVEGQLEYADKLKEERNIDYVFVNQSKYTELLGERNKAFRERNFIVIALASAFVCGLAFSRSGFNSMNNLYRISAMGFKKSSIKRAATDVLIISVMSWAVYLIYIIHALRLYNVDLYMLSHSVLCLYVFADFPLDISVGGYLLGVGVCRNLICAAFVIAFNYILYRKARRL